MAKAKRQQDKLERVRLRQVRLSNPAPVRRRRQSSKCAETLEIIDNGRWDCNGRTEECQLQCEDDFIRVGRIRKNCTCVDDNCFLIPDEPSLCESAIGE